jgi:C4-dicarboxylate transporter DctQ subunit
MVKKIYMRLQSVQTVVIAFILGIMMTLIIINVITRFVFNYTLSWSEECARYLFVQLIFLGCSLGIKENKQIRIDLIDNFLKGKSRKTIELLRHAISLIATCVLILGGMGLIEAGRKVLSAGMRLPMFLFYICIPIGCILCTIELIHQIIISLKTWKGVDV